MTTTAAYCYANGVIGFDLCGGAKVPTGAIWFARGDDLHVRSLVEVTARHGYTAGVLLVPGVPEAKSQRAGLDALFRYELWLAGRSDVRALGIEINGAQTARRAEEVVQG